MKLDPRGPDQIQGVPTSRPEHLRPKEAMAWLLVADIAQQAAAGRRYWDMEGASQRFGSPITSMTELLRTAERQNWIRIIADASIIEAADRSWALPYRRRGKRPLPPGAQRLLEVLRQAAHAHRPLMPHRELARLADLGTARGVTIALGHLAKHKLILRPSKGCITSPDGRWTLTQDGDLPDAAEPAQRLETYLSSRVRAGAGVISRQAAAEALDMTIVQFELALRDAAGQGLVTVSGTGVMRLVSHANGWSIALPGKIDE